MRLFHILIISLSLTPASQPGRYYVWPYHLFLRYVVTQLVKLLIFWPSNDEKNELYVCIRMWMRKNSIREEEMKKKSEEM